MSTGCSDPGERAVCRICGALTVRQATMAGRLYGAVLKGALDLGSTHACWDFLATGADAIPGLAWDDFLAGRTAAIRMIQDRARRTLAATPRVADAA